jgi:hypothetical protein
LKFLLLEFHIPFALFTPLFRHWAIISFRIAILHIKSSQYLFDLYKTLVLCAAGRVLQSLGYAHSRFLQVFIQRLLSVAALVAEAKKPQISDFIDGNAAYIIQKVLRIY